MAADNAVSQAKAQLRIRLNYFKWALLNLKGEVWFCFRGLVALKRLKSCICHAIHSILQLGVTVCACAGGEDVRVKLKGHVLILNASWPHKKRLPKAKEEDGIEYELVLI